LETKTIFLSFGVCWKASKASNDVNYDELTKRQTVQNANDEVMRTRWRGVRLEKYYANKKLVL